MKMGNGIGRKNLGKKFEDVIKESFLKCPNVSIDRLRDAPKKMKNVDNPSDFIVYKYPHEVYVECKSHKGNTLPFSCIRTEQLVGMTEKAKINGVKAGVIVWYIDHDITVWYSIGAINGCITNGDKSLNVKDIPKFEYQEDCIVIQGKKKRIYFDYFMDDFLRRLYEH